MRMLPLKNKAFMAMAVGLTVICSSASAQVVNTPATAQIDQMEAQSRGEYAELNIDYARPLGLQQNAWVDPLKHMGEGQTKPAYSRYYWKPDVVLPIRLREGMVTLVNFPQWELVENVFIGDEVTFDGQIVASNAILVYPKQPGSDTNMVVFTRSGNRYVFYLRSETYNAERITNSIVDIEVIGGPEGAKVSGNTGAAAGKPSSGGVSPLTPIAKKATAVNDNANWLDNVAVDPTKFRFDLDVFVPYPEDVVIAPERVWRDEVFTYIDLGQKAISMHQRPVVSLIIEGVESPVGTRTEGPYGRMIVVEAVGDLVLRSGRRVVCIKMQKEYDDALDMSGVKIPGWTPPKEGAAGSSWQDSGNRMPNNSVNMGYAGTNAGNGSVNGGAPAVAPNGMLIPNGAVNGSVAHSFVNGAAVGGANSGHYGTATSSEYALSVELGASKDVRKLEDMWSGYMSTNKDLLSVYKPFYALDMSADSVGDEAMFHLRIGPVSDLVAGDDLCRKLGERGISCMVVRTQ